MPTAKYTISKIQTMKVDSFHHQNVVTLVHTRSFYISLTLKGLLIPHEGLRMKMRQDGSIKDIPNQHFIHPDTCVVLPIIGNTLYNVELGSIVCDVNDNTKVRNDMLVCWAGDRFID